MNPVRPKRLFRFFSPKASGLFVSKELWFSSLIDFNDPFEALPDYASTIQGLVDTQLKKEFAFLPPSSNLSWPDFRQRYFQSRFKQALQEIPQFFQSRLFSPGFGVLCLASHFDDDKSLLMWGHYTDGHKGFAVELDPNHRFFETDNKTDLFGEVRYKQKRPDFAIGLAQFFLEKNEQWRYEGEYRLIKPFTDLKHAESNGKAIQYLDLPPDLIQAVYLGCRMTEEKRGEIQKALQSPEWKHVRLFMMQIHETEYALRPVPIAEWSPPSPEAVNNLEEALATAIDKKKLDPTVSQYLKKQH